MDSLSLTPIGHVRTAKRLKFDAPHQPDEALAETNRVELLPSYELALDDLASFDRIWLIWWFHRKRRLAGAGPTAARPGQT